jgi:hypothetical protein
MKFGLWTANGALNSKPVFEAFAQGVKKLGYSVCLNMESDIEVIWSVLWSGRMTKNKLIWDRCRQKNKPIIVLEIGCFRRGTTWKVAVNGVNRDAYFGEKLNNDQRVKKLNLKLHDWKTNTGPILIACQHLKSGQWKDINHGRNYINDTIKSLRMHTDKEIVVRPHPRNPIRIDLAGFKNVKIQYPKKLFNTYDDYDLIFENYTALVNHSSNPAILAAMNGIPIFTSSSSLAYEVSNQNFSTINNPSKPDRYQWLNDLSYTEWTLDEISTGEPLNRLTKAFK